MSLQSRYRFSAAWLPGGWRRNVVISVDPAGDIVDVAPDDVVTTARLISGVAIPGMPNVHSHAFQRSMAGLAERRSAHADQGDSFWTWRETMYEHASRMSPECLNAVAAQCYADMLKAGYTAVCEFHYLHNQPDGTPYADRGVMCQALIDAASTAGIGLTLLPTLYQTSDFGGAPPTPRQRQFVLPTDQYLDLVDELTRAQSPQVEIGIALHSLRAVPADALRTVLTSLPANKVVHIHIAEQEREVAAAQAQLHARPIEWLLEHARVDRRWCLVHATHATHAELKAVAATDAVIALCPTTEANLGDGIFPLQAWLAAGGAFAIGSDSHISLSPVEELRWLEYESRLITRHRNVVATADEPSSGALLWRRACNAGTRATGRNIGALEAGRRADIVVIDSSTPLFAGRSDDDLLDTFIFAGGGQEVRDVMVAGRWLVQEGRHFAETAIAAGYKRAMASILR
ncbi:MAG TPA: formimidoylglutamate deiminase [Steroidobacteraceae bacterium]|nr:formimidoylglutamate deiminase [Steroidobacteraceae bacterium]